VQKQTPLYAAHRAAGARMVDFGGWDMPVGYGSQIEEHHAVRRDAGMFDVSHMCTVDLRGAGVRPLLLRLLANDVGRLAAPGKALAPNQAHIVRLLNLVRNGADAVAETQTPEPTITIRAQRADRRIEFDVTARDEIEEIGNGTHERMVVDLGRLAQRLEAKKRS